MASRLSADTRRKKDKTAEMVTKIVAAPSP